MGKNPAFQFYPNDWSRDLEEHPLEIEGAWIRICCKLWWSETRGTIAFSLTKWARVMRVGEKKSKSILEYLLNQRIADGVNQNGLYTITCRRMIRDEYIRTIRKEAGEKGGNPLLIKNRDLDKQNLVNQNQTPSSSSSSSTSKKKEYTPDFLNLWDLYPARNGQKAGKKQALEEWDKLNPDGTLQKIILEKLTEQKKTQETAKQNQEFFAEFPDACRWLKHRRWEDETKEVSWRDRVKSIK